MKTETTKSFDLDYQALPVTLRVKTRITMDRFVQAFESRRFPKGLRVHKCGPFVSLSVTMSLRIFVYPVAGGVRFVFIGTHADADRYLRK